MKINKLMQLLQDNATARGPAAGASAAGEAPPAIRVEAAADAGEAHVYIYDVIDAWWGASAAALIAALAIAGERPLHLHINSPGGDVFEARAMAAAIVAYPGNVTTHIDGLAASAATYLALSGNEVRITDGALFMIHNSWTLGFGDKTELRKTADLLDKIDGTILADYATRTGASADQVKTWMDAETWFTAAEALAAGFVDHIDSNTKTAADKAAQASASAARWNLSAYAHPPKLPAPQQDDAADAEAAAAILAAQVSAQLAHNRARLRALHHRI